VLSPVLLLRRARSPSLTTRPTCLQGRQAHHHPLPLPTPRKWGERKSQCDDTPLPLALLPRLNSRGRTLLPVSSSLMSSNTRYRQATRNVRRRRLASSQRACEQRMPRLHHHSNSKAHASEQAKHHSMFSYFNCQKIL